MTELNLREKMSDTEKARNARGAILDDDKGALVEFADRRFDVITPETEEDAASWTSGGDTLEYGKSVLILRPSYRIVAGTNPTGRFGKDKFTFFLDENGDIEEGVGNNDMVKGILLSVLRCFFGGKDNMPDMDPVYLLVNKFELIQGLQARCDITGHSSARGTSYNQFRSWKVAS